MGTAVTRKLGSEMSIYELRSGERRKLKKSERRETYGRFKKKGTCVTERRVHTLRVKKIHRNIEWLDRRKKAWKRFCRGGSGVGQLVHKRKW